MKTILSSLFSGGVTNPQVPVSGAIFQSTCVLDRVRLFVTEWTVATGQAPLSRGFPRQEYWSGLPLASSRRSSHPRDWTHVSCGFCTDWWILYHWATWAVHNSECLDKKADVSFFFSLFLTHSFVLAIAYTLILAKRIKADLKSISVYK